MEFTFEKTGLKGLQLVQVVANKLPKTNRSICNSGGHRLRQFRKCIAKFWNTELSSIGTPGCPGNGAPADLPIRGKGRWSTNLIISDPYEHGSHCYLSLRTAVTGKWSLGNRPSKEMRSMFADSMETSRETAIQSILAPSAVPLKPLKVPAGSSPFACLIA